MFTERSIMTKSVIFIPSDCTSNLFELLRERRGWTNEYIREINDPTYDVLKDLPQLLDELNSIRESGKQIVIMPDFDMDGITSGTIAYAGLAELGFNVGLYIPDFRRGHDLTAAAVDEMYKQFPDVHAIITTDSGVNSHEGIGRAKELGLKVLVTDHHVQLDQQSPADIIVDPSRIDEDYSHTGVCGAFVIWQILYAFAKKYVPVKIRDIALLKLFAGVGTISDVMPLLYENRQLVRDSISIARLLYVPLPPEDSATPYNTEESTLMLLLRAQTHSEPFINAFEGFAQVLRAFREYGPLEMQLDLNGDPLIDDNTGEPIVIRKNGKLRSSDAIDEEFYAWYLAPAFNAIRRVEGDMKYAFGAFTASTPEERFACAKQVIDYNRKRKEMTEKYLEELLDREQPYTPFIWLTSAPTGMLGLIANKMMEEHGMPVVVIQEQPDDSEPRGGSARAPFWFNIIQEMTPEGFTAVGHEQACGIRLRNQSEMERFVEVMRERANALLDKLASDGTLAEKLQPDLVIGDTPDCDTTLENPEELLELALAIDTMRPFGHEFPMPEVEFALNIAQCKLQVIGQDQSHLRIVTQSGIKILWWGKAELIMILNEKAQAAIVDDSIVRLRGNLVVNDFRQTQSVQMLVSKVVDEKGMPCEI